MEPHKGNATNQHMQQKSLSAVTAQGPEDIMQHKFQNTYTQACEMKIARNQTKRSQRIIKNREKGVRSTSSFPLQKSHSKERTK